MNPRPMALGCPRGDRSSGQQNAFSFERRPDTALVSTRGKEREMLSATLGMLAMLPVVFGVAGYAMVSR
jgi:hypothetical protein